MKKFISSFIIIISLFFSSANFADAALTFGANTTDKVDFGNTASLTNLTAVTVLLWHYPTTFTSARRIWIKGLAGGSPAGTGNLRMQISDTSGNYFASHGRLTTNDQATSNTLPAVLNTWNFVAYTWDISDNVRIFSGNLTTPAAQTSYSARTVGSGAQGNDSVGQFNVGNDAGASPTAPYQGRIAFFHVIARRLTLGEIIQQQWNPHVVNETRLFTHLGFNGTGTQPDWSGNGNSGTVTGATVSAHVPLRPRSF